MPADDEQPPRIQLGISSCLLGQPVRYDGSHKHHRYITDTLGQYFEFHPFCPEVAIGLGVPRPTLQLVQVGKALRVRGVEDGSLDVSERLAAYAAASAGRCAELSGYIFKSRSPSCGMQGVSVHSEQGHPLTEGAGLFAAGIMQRFPQLPVEEEGRLMEPQRRENFINRVYIYHRWQRYRQQGLTPARLVEFHSRHKFILLAHDEPAYRELGRLVAEVGRSGLQELAEEYLRRLMQALQLLASPQSHTNVLQHIMGFFKQQLGAADKQELLGLIDGYRRGQLPLSAPLSLLRHYLHLYPNEYIALQYYMTPPPGLLMLPNEP